MVYLHSFACGFPVSVKPFVEEIVVSSMNIFGTLVQKKSINLFLNLFSIPLVYISVFRPEPRCFAKCTFVVNCKIRACESSRFVHIFQDWSGYSVLENP